MKINNRKIWMIPAALLLSTVLVAVVMLLWNWLMPAIFGIKAISFWQAAGLLILSKILFGSFGGHKHGWTTGGGFRKHNRMHERWMSMSEEERTEFINRRMNHFHHHPFGGKDRFGHDFGRRNADEKPSSERQQ